MNVWNNEKKRYTWVRGALFAAFFLSFLLPVTEKIPYGAVAAGFSLTELMDYPSLGAVIGVLPNLVVLYLLFRGRKALLHNVWILLSVFIVSYLGVLTWMTFPEAHHIIPSLSQVGDSFGTLRFGYWLWNLSILGLYVFHLTLKLRSRHAAVA